MGRIISQICEIIIGWGVIILLNALSLIKSINDREG